MNDRQAPALATTVAVLTTAAAVYMATCLATKRKASEGSRGEVLIGICNEVEFCFLVNTRRARICRLLRLLSAAQTVRVHVYFGLTRARYVVHR